MSEFLRENRVPGFCPVCGSLMKGDKSTSTYYSFGCCSDCFIEFVDGREERWRTGWRPTSEQIAKFLKQFEPSYEL